MYEVNGVIMVVPMHKCINLKMHKKDGAKTKQKSAHVFLHIFMFVSALNLNQKINQMVDVIAADMAAHNFAAEDPSCPRYIEVKQYTIFLVFSFSL
jgi:hypothetical protein